MLLFDFLNTVRFIFQIESTVICLVLSENMVLQWLGFQQESVLYLPFFSVTCNLGVLQYCVLYWTTL